MVEERKEAPYPHQGNLHEPGVRKQLAEAFEVWNAKLGLCSKDLLRAEAINKL